MYELINIPKETYEELKNIPNFTSNTASQAVRDGIPLPINQDRLMILSENAVKDNSISDSLNRKWISETGLSNATIKIIETDKEYGKITDMELMQVLGEVADDCFYRRACGGCKFDRNGECILKGTPADWDIETIKERTE